MGDSGWRTLPGAIHQRSWRKQLEQFREHHHRFRQLALCDQCGQRNRAAILSNHCELIGHLLNPAPRFFDGTDSTEYVILEMAMRWVEMGGVASGEWQPLGWR